MLGAMSPRTYAFQKFGHPKFKHFKVNETLLCRNNEMEKEFAAFVMFVVDVVGVVDSIYGGT